MPLKRKTSNERALAELDSKLDDARAELARCRQSEEEAQQGRTKLADEAAAALGMQEINRAEYARRIAEADERIARARSEREAIEAAVQALSSRAADAAEAIGRRRLDDAQENLRLRAAALAEAEIAFQQRQAEKGEAETNVAIVEHEVAFARAPYDADAQAALEARERQEQEQVDWWAREWPETYGEHTPVVLHSRIAQRISEMVAESAAVRERKREPDASSPDVDGVPVSGVFPRLPAPL